MNMPFPIIFLSFLLLSGGLHAQERKTSVDLVQSDRKQQVAFIVGEIEQGIAAGNASFITKYFTKQVYLRVRGMEEGYYSANHAASIVQNFLNTYRVINFRLTTVGGSDATRYATGGGTFFFRGQREVFQVYVSISYVEGQWVITQFSLY
jgi:hypothetical protein